MSAHRIFRRLSAVLFPFLTLCAACGSTTDEAKDSIDVQTATLDLPSQKTSRTVDISASGLWTVSCSSHWCKAVKSSPSTLLVIAEQNADRQTRTAFISVQCGKAAAEITVSQQAGSASLSVTPSEFLVDAAPSQCTLSISSNTHWSLSCPEEWIAITPAEGDGDGQATINCGQNHSDRIRTAVITAEYTGQTAGETSSITAQLSQRAVLPHISLSERIVGFDNLPSSRTLTLDVTGEWSVQVPDNCPWLSVSPQSGISGRHEIEISVTENKSKTQSRTASLRFNAPGSKFAILDITQSTAPGIDFTVSLMDYNTHNCIGTDNIYDALRIYKVLSAYSPDCIAVQETDSVTQRPETKGRYVLGEIARNMRMEAVFYPTLDSYRSGKYGIGMLSKEKPLSCRGAKIPYTSEQRGVLAVEFGDFWYLCTHFDAGEEQRLQAAEQITEMAAELSSEKPVFLAGDFNARPSEKCISYLRQHFTALNDTDLPTAGYANGSSSTKCIDYIFLYNRVGGKEINHQIIKREIVDTPLSRTASDHFPLFVRIRITE